MFPCTGTMSFKSSLNVVDHPNGKRRHKSQHLLVVNDFTCHLEVKTKKCLLQPYLLYGPEYGFGLSWSGVYGAEYGFGLSWSGVFDDLKL